MKTATSAVIKNELKYSPMSEEEYSKAKTRGITLNTTQ